MPETQTAVTLKTLLASYPNTAALRDGRLTSPMVHFDFEPIKTANKAFKALVRDQKLFMVDRMDRASYRARARTDYLPGNLCRGLRSRMDTGLCV